MKRIIVFSGLFVFIFMYCTTPPQSTMLPQLTMLPPSERQYQKVVEVEFTKQEIYQKALMWMAESFRSSKEVIEHKNSEEGKIIGNTIVTINFGEGIYVPHVMDVRMTIIIEMKDRRIRFTAKNLIYSDLIIMGVYIPESHLEYKEQLDKITPQIDMLINDFKNYLKESSKLDEW